MSEDICPSCNSATPPKSKGKKKKPTPVKWIGCDTCLRWYHAACMRISDALMEQANDYQYFCESCTVRGRLVPKTVPTNVAPSVPPCDVEKLEKTISELSSQLSKLQAELLSLRDNNKKQYDRLQNRLRNDSRIDTQCAARDKLVSNISEKLDLIQSGAKLAGACSQAVNSFRLAVNKIPFREGENVRTIFEDILNLLGIHNEMSHVASCFRLPVKPSKWTNRALTPTIVVVLDSCELRQRILRAYFEKHKEAKLCNLRDGPELEYRFTLNEVLSASAFRLRNLALRFKQRKMLQSVYVKNNNISVLLPGQRRYVPVEDSNHLHQLFEHESNADCSSIFFDATSADLSASSHQ